MKRQWQLAGVFITVFGLGLALSCAGDDGGGDSPEDVVAAMKKAAKTNDYRAIIEHTAPADRPAMVAMAAMFARLNQKLSSHLPPDFAGTKSKDNGLAEVAKVVKKYGLDDIRDPNPSMAKDKLREWATEQVGDIDLHDAFVDIVSAMEKVDVGRSGKSDAGLEIFGIFDGDPAVTDMKIDGDHASMKVGGQDMNCQKIDGRWYIGFDPSRR